VAGQQVAMDEKLALVETVATAKPAEG